MNNIVVFASGSGSNFQAIIDSVNSGDIPATISGLLASRNGIQSIERARKNNIPVQILSESEFKTDEAYVSALVQTLEDWKPDLIVLAGYMKKIPGIIIKKYANRIINIHPSLLPKYGGKGYFGLNVHKAVIANGEKESGCTVHVVTNEYDSGPVLEQTRVPVFPDDTPEALQKRILVQEHLLLPKVIRQILTSKKS